jgi:hypothetical protein
MKHEATRATLTMILPSGDSPPPTQLTIVHPRSFVTMPFLTAALFHRLLLALIAGFIATPSISPCPRDTALNQDFQDLRATRQLGRLIGGRPGAFPD